MVCPQLLPASSSSLSIDATTISGYRQISCSDNDSNNDSNNDSDGDDDSVVTVREVVLNPLI